MDFRNIISSRINQNDLINNPELSKALEKDKVIRLDFLSPVKPNIIDTKGLKNEKKKNMIENINLFKKKYYQDHLINKNSLEKIYKISNENNVFLNHFSGFNKYYNNQNQKEILNDIQLEYKKKMGFTPIIKENANLFSNSILLQNDRDLKQYISLDLNTIKNDSNSLSFLKNVQNKIQKNAKNKRNNILEKIVKKDLVDEFAKENDIVNIRKTINKYKSAPIEREKYESINDLKKDILKTKESFNSINNLNLFLNTIDSRKSSGKTSTRINSGVETLNDKMNLNNDNINFFHKINNRNNIYKENNNDKNKTIAKSCNSIILPLIQNNNDSLRNESNQKKIKDNENRSIDYIKISEPKNEDMINKLNINKNHYKSINNKKSKKKQVKKIILRKYELGLENLYEKISKTENYIDYNKEIKNYLKSNNYDVNDKINAKDLYKTVDKNRKKIINISFIQKNNELISNSKINNFEQNKDMIQYNKKIKKNIENIEERMIGLMCDVNKY